MYELESFNNIPELEKSREMSNYSRAMREPTEENENNGKNDEDIQLRMDEINQPQNIYIEMKFNGYISTIDSNNKLTNLSSTKLSTQNLSEVVSYINNNDGVTNFQVNIPKMIENYTKIWNDFKTNGLINEMVNSKFDPLNISNEYSFVMPMLLLGSQTGIYSLNSASFPGQSLPVQGLTNNYKQATNSISLSFPNIIFTSKSTEYFNYFFFNVNTDLDTDIDIDRRKELLLFKTLLSDFLNKLNINNKANKVQIVNLINILLEIGMNTLIISIVEAGAHSGGPVNQELILTTLTNLLTNFLRKIPDDKCYFDNGYLITTPDICGSLNNKQSGGPPSSCPVCPSITPTVCPSITPTVCPSSLPENITFRNISIGLFLCIIILVILVVYFMTYQK